MPIAYLQIETHDDHPGQLRFVPYDSAPAPHEILAPRRAHYTAKYNNVFRAEQQIQGLLSKQLINADNSLYEISVVEAIAQLESAPLKPQRVWINPELADDELAQIDQKIAALNRRRARRDSVWKLVGAGFIVLLALRAIGQW